MNSVRFKPSRETLNLMAADRRRGIQTKIIARNVGCSPSLAHYYLKKMGVAGKPGGGVQVPNDMQPHRPVFSMEAEMRAARAALRLEIQAAKAERNFAPLYKPK